MGFVLTGAAIPPCGKWNKPGQEPNGRLKAISRDVLIDWIIKFSLIILREKLHDNRFIRLIQQLLEAGYLEEWRYYPTMSGSPQGGVVSPILSNIYLDQLDKYVEQELLPAFTRGEQRQRNPDYNDSVYESNTTASRAIEEKPENCGGSAKYFLSAIRLTRTIDGFDLFDMQMISAWDLQGRRKRQRTLNTFSRLSCKSNSSLNCQKRRP